MLYSSLLKRGTTCVSDEKTCVVDTNELIAKKLEDYQKSRDEQTKTGFRAGLQVQELELTDNVEEDENLLAIFNEEQQYSGPDPEVSTRNSVLTPGFDWSAYPRAMGVTAGVSFTF